MFPGYLFSILCLMLRCSSFKQSTTSSLENPFHFSYVSKDDANTALTCWCWTHCINSWYIKIKVLLFACSHRSSVSHRNQFESDGQWGVRIHGDLELAGNWWPRYNSVRVRISTGKYWVQLVSILSMAGSSSYSHWILSYRESSLYSNLHFECALHS